MFIDRVSRQLMSAPELAPLLSELGGGSDAVLAVAQSARPLLVAALWARDPRPCLLVVSGEEAADRAGRALAAWLGRERVARYPERRDWPWSEKAADDAVIGARCNAVARLAAGEACVVVASARSLMRRVPPVGSGYYASSTFAVGDEVDFADMGLLLVGMGYTEAGASSDVTAPGTFHIHGDSVDVYPAQASSPVRIEFFGDEIDRIRRMVASTGQTIGELHEVTVSPCREIAFTAKTIANAERALYRVSRENKKVAADLELIRAHAADPSLDRYLPLLYGGSATPIEHLAQQTLVVLAEPRALFDDCQRAADEIQAAANAARVPIEGLYTMPKAMSFGTQQRLSLSSIMVQGGNATAELEVRQPAIAGPDTKLLGRVRQLLADHCAVVFAAPDRGAREHLKLSFIDEHIPFCESLATAPENQQPFASGGGDGRHPYWGNAPVPAGGRGGATSAAVAEAASAPMGSSSHASASKNGPAIQTPMSANGRGGASSATVSAAATSGVSTHSAAPGTHAGRTASVTPAPATGDPRSSASMNGPAVQAPMPANSRGGASSATVSAAATSGASTHSAASGTHAGRTASASPAPGSSRPSARRSSSAVQAPIPAPTPLGRGTVTFTDLPVPAGVVIPTAQLAVLSVGDLTARTARKSRGRRVDPTAVTFPFKPGDYVVHATHGIALFSEIVRQEVGGRERDYFLLEYAGGDKLYVPLEQVDRVTRYIGPDGTSPRLTRLNTADWSRVTGKARASAKKLAFDLVDLYTRRSSVTGYAFSPDTPAQADMEASFPYEVTDDQQRAVADIKADMESARPMDRLLCGDVGFGKTEVALRAAFKCCQDAKQVMVLCPTTILAEQHFQTFFERFAPFDVQVRVLSRFVTPAQQRQALKGFADGSVQVLIGTHRLLSADVNPYDLGLVIIDEEQRFGVQHKEQLKNMREQVDVLTLSATPIPRTMQMAVSGVRDMSLILTPPPGRLPVKVTVGEFNPDVVSDAIRLELARKGQVYYVSNRVHTIEEAMERVLEAAPEARVGVAHGQMSAAQVEDVMLQFSAREIDVLVATTIIESGIDNPHTNTLIIEDAQRLGLAQLYQLKGRVGRGRLQAYAYFMFPGELPLTPEATDRLLALDEFQDLGSGMRIAMRDLEIRGAGSLMGAEQHGNLSGVGFDLFTQMLGQAVAEARGETGEVEVPEVTINLQADFYLAEEFLPEVDKRVLAYRRLAAATELAEVDALQMELEERYGAMPLAGKNLFDRARVRIRAGRLGCTSVSLTGGRIVFQGVDVPKRLVPKFKAKRALVLPKSQVVKYPFHTTREEIMPAALGVLEELGGDDDAE